MSFAAQWPGVCGACDDRFPAGTEVAYDSDGDLVHVDCPSTTHAPRPLCTYCFVELPYNGRCDCRD